MIIPPSNPITVTIANEEYALRYPIRQLKAIEQESGVSILKLASQAQDANITIANIETVLFYGLQGADDSLSRKKVELLIEADYTGCLNAFGVAIAKALGVDDAPTTEQNEQSEGHTPGESIG